MQITSQKLVHCLCRGTVPIDSHPMSTHTYFLSIGNLELSAVTEKEDISLFYSHIFSDRNLQIDKSSIMFFTFLLEQLEQQVLYFLLSGV